MGIVKKQKKEIESMRRRVEYWKAISNNRAQRAQKAEATLAAAEKMLTIMVKRLGGKVEIHDCEWAESMKVWAKHDEEKGITEFILKE